MNIKTVIILVSSLYCMSCLLPVFADNENAKEPTRANLEL